jgi:hypothetical protein
MALFFTALSGCKKELLVPHKTDNNIFTVAQAKNYFNAHAKAFRKKATNSTLSETGIPGSLLDSMKQIWKGAYQKKGKTVDMGMV